MYTIYDWDECSTNIKSNPEYVYKLLFNNGATKEDMADYLNVSTRQITMWCNHGSMPSWVYDILERDYE